MRRKRGIIHWVWVMLCTFVGAIMIGALLGLKMQSWPMAGVGLGVGAVLGYGFGKLVPISEFLTQTFD